MRYPLLFADNADADGCLSPALLATYFDVVSTALPTGFFLWTGGQLCWVNERNEQLKVDLASNKLLWRFANLNKAQEPLLRALGWKNGQSKRVWDLTAGLGRDGALMAYAGYSVTLFERAPVVQILLLQALYQLAETHCALREHLSLVTQDAITYITSMVKQTQAPEIIYLDPMYPHRKKAALVKLDLRMVRDLVGEDSDSHELLTLALNTGVARIVVKRPAKAEFLGGYKPHHSIQAPNTRFDVYGQ